MMTDDPVDGATPDRESRRFPTPGLSWDYAGCRRRSCQNGHSFVWGECAYALEPPPRPRLYRHDVVAADDGYASIVTRPMTPAEVAGWLREHGYTVTAAGDLS